MSVQASKNSALPSIVPQGAGKLGLTEQASSSGMPDLTPSSGLDSIGMVSAPLVPDTIPIQEIREISGK